MNTNAPIVNRDDRSFSSQTLYPIHSFDYGADVYLHHHQQQQHPLPVVRVNRSAGHTSTTLNFSSESTSTIPSGQLVEMCILRSGTRTSHVPFAGRVPMPMHVL